MTARSRCGAGSGASSRSPRTRSRAAAQVADPRVRVALGRPGLGVGGLPRQPPAGARRPPRRAVRPPRRPARALRRRDRACSRCSRTTSTAPGGSCAGRSARSPPGDEATRRLLDTLRVFQEEGQSFARTAARLEVHQNTAAYRVKRALELAGKDDASSLALRAAVSLVPLVGDAEPGAGG